VKQRLRSLLTVLWAPAIRPWWFVSWSRC